MKHLERIILAVLFMGAVLMTDAQTRRVKQVEKKLDSLEFRVRRAVGDLKQRVQTQEGR